MISIKSNDNGTFTVEQGHKAAPELTYDEMLGLISQLTMPSERRCLQWMRPKVGHLIQEAIDRGYLEASVIIPSHLLSKMVIVHGEKTIDTLENMLILRDLDGDMMGDDNASAVIYRDGTWATIIK
jgi:hypothetical protein